MTIRAVLKNGMILPVEPVPQEWAEGQELEVAVTERHSTATLEDSAKWLREMDELTAVLDDPGEWAQIEATLADGDRQAKEFVRREMGLP